VGKSLLFLPTFLSHNAKVDGFLLFLPTFLSHNTKVDHAPPHPHLAHEKTAAPERRGGFIL